MSVPWGQYQKALKELGDSIRSQIDSAYRTQKITKFEFTYNTDGNLETIKAYNSSTLLFTLTFAYNSNQDITNITRS